MVRLMPSASNICSYYCDIWRILILFIVRAGQDNVQSVDHSRNVAQGGEHDTNKEAPPYSSLKSYSKWGKHYSAKQKQKSSKSIVRHVDSA
ncbi:hypothetical protein AYI68_g7813 [Smittium mucronatum]|uniref:Uncharacterized protein n=1 Tax=Smittium mucronatum TaxID=133383 RepID=A0A1R0GMP1_9FUNG|nr:hypothetical protein AYI68_g7813 [Smittium mucronatum]